MAPKKGSTKPAIEKQKDSEVYSETAIRNNFSSLEYARTCQSAAAGIAAGVLGLTSLPGFVFYFLTVLVQGAVWEAKAGFDWKTYFVDRSLSLTHSLVGGLFTYVLFWVFLYGMVHVY
ncbi:unnamed protein product [Auanema sp. JU1783]|nr:unnamed protein product [Auanema sp. JU1783]